MARTIGPGRMPGETLRLIEPVTCDQCDLPATIAVVGETDSFGSEVLELCAEHHMLCMAAQREREAAQTQCELCHNYTTDCSAWRDPEEGLAGPLYTACKKCRTEANERFAMDLSGEEEGDDDFTLPPADFDGEDDE